MNDQMNHQLNAKYEDALLRVTFSLPAEASLFINGINRDTASSDATEVTLKLGSPVQTGYEQHEFIEVLIQYTEDSISVRILSGEQLIAQQDVSL
ncbi:MAG: hypothetical protein ACJAYE_000721 [Candidatus Azotimanducaceae bacterium]|jgi:hypothetical protein